MDENCCLGWDPVIKLCELTNASAPWHMCRECISNNFVKSSLRNFPYSNLAEYRYYIHGCDICTSFYITFYIWSHRSKMLWGFNQWQQLWWKFTSITIAITIPMNTLNKVIVSTNRISLTFCMTHCLYIAKDKLKLSMLCWRAKLFSIREMAK